MVATGSGVAGWMAAGRTEICAEALRPSTVAVIVALPALTARASPAAVTRTIAGAELFQTTALPSAIGVPSAANSRAVNGPRRRTSRAPTTTTAHPTVIQAAEIRRRLGVASRTALLRTGGAAAGAEGRFGARAGTALAAAPVSRGARPRLPQFLQARPPRAARSVFRREDRLGGRGAH